ncbi:DoxX family protein [Chitinophaga sancti]|uniref:DoxX family protein n=1 Tax=Chitinophaga sancti TaxID=1004 RepID=A0A1K1S583_9BACT|nr:DoxX family protein [Chitinophaga sancti]WQD63654.1 DoxX family protein [Chitinophaga sancti]WQG90721.1 DoxX family protein [Chitinophaga sancti]SFW79478.1 DoxX protein [Chitinophaga sancti]
MKGKFDIPQLFLRLSLGLGFLLPVMDRFGWLGAAGINGNAWGNWGNFVSYTHSLMPYLSELPAKIMAIFATFGEIIFGIALLIGFKVRIAAFGSFLLTLTFALSMFIFSGPRIPFNYSVFVVSAASLLLAYIPDYKWGISNK